jgi:hypothetical protein
MRRSLAVTAASLLFLSAAAFLAVAQSDEMSLDGCGEKKSAVAFPHKAHAELMECATCHHTQEGLTADSGDEVPTCKSCHLDPTEEGALDCAQMSPSKNPYHVNCMGCHKKEKKGPVKCDECHPKA